MKYLLSLSLLILCLFSFHSCGDDNVNNNANTPPDFDIYLVKKDFQNNLVSTYTIKSDGSDRKLFNDSMEVCTNSYHNKILLKCYPGFADTIYISDYDGRNMTAISLGNYFGSNFSLSPKADKFNFIALTQQLFVMNVDGSGLVKISDYQSNYCKFSPSGNMIVFFEPSYYPNHRGTKLFISNTSGTYKKLLKDSIQDGGFAEWSNDGKRIAYHYLSFELHSLRIGVIDTSGNYYSELADGGFPAWSPKGNKICFINYSGSRSDLFLIDPDGTNIVNITNTWDLSENNIRWSKEGMRILYNTYEGSNPSKLWMYDLNSNSNTLLADSVSYAIWQ